MASTSNSTTLGTTGGQSFTLYTSFNETGTNVANNTSTVYCYASLNSSNVSFSVTNAGTLYLYWHDNHTNSDRLVNSLSISQCGMSYGGKAIDGTIYPEHNSDGNLNGYAWAYWERSSKGGSYPQWVPVTGSVATENTALTYIARKSILNGFSFNIANNGTVTVTPNITKYSSSFTDNLTLYNGNSTITLSGVSHNTAKTLTSSQANTLFNVIGTGMSANFTGYLTTYSGESSIGNSNNMSATATLPNYSLSWSSQSCEDNVTAYNAYKNNATDLIANLSNPKLTFASLSNTGSNYGRSIGYTVNGSTSTSPKILTNYTGGSISVKASDGRTSKDLTWNVGNTVISYVKPTISCKITRPSPTGSTAVVTIKGAYYDGYGLKTSALLTRAIRLVYQEQGGSQVTKNTGDFSISESTSNHVTSFTATLTITGLDYKKSITYSTYLTDKIGISPQADSGTVPQGLPAWNCYLDNNNQNHTNVNGILEINNVPVLDYEVVDTW